METPANSTVSNFSIIDPHIHNLGGASRRFGRLYGSAKSLLMAELAKSLPTLTLIVTEDMNTAILIEEEIRFFLGKKSETPLLSFPDWETLPYDVFSPHQDIVSQRLETLYRLPQLSKGILIVPISVLMQRVCPSSFLESQVFILKSGDTFEINEVRSRLENAGYRCVPQVTEHGEFAVRGSLMDLFPMGSEHPIRIDLFDDIVDSLRLFDPESQRTISKIDQIRLLPAREFPFSKQAITQFRQAYRETFEGDPQKTSVYRDVSNEIMPPGLEYYLPLFFSETATLFDYLPTDTQIFADQNVEEAAHKWWAELNDRYEQRRYDIERPLLAPNRLYLSDGELFEHREKYDWTTFQIYEFDPLMQPKNAINCATTRPKKVKFASSTDANPFHLRQFVDEYAGRVLFVAESDGRREVLLPPLREQLQSESIRVFADWNDFLASRDRIGVTVAPIEHGLQLENPPITIITDAQLFGQKIQQQRKHKTSQREADAIIHNLTELTIGSPVVHQDHGVGRYLGLQHLTVGNIENEFLTIEYSGGDKLYVPVSSLHLIGRYTGGADNAPLHRLGTDQWEKAKRKAAEKARDVAAELLEIHARREAAKGIQIHVNHDEYDQFAAAFPFEETPDQLSAINAIVADIQKQRPMDRLVCGDVGFGKTEVAMRAAFTVAADGKQVAVLVPTTLLANQHFNNFSDRFANWPFRIEVLSRFRSKKELEQSLKSVKEGTVDIVIGTHKLLQEGIAFKNLGLLIVDEEHRFGVQQKEKVKALCANVHLLSLTATPIPRTLNLALSGLRDLSIIATPPNHRMAVKTFVTQWNNENIREACLREIKRGGQVYFLHNDVESIQRIARELQELIPQASVSFAHGQMREKELEQVMMDFYHRRFNLLVCTTIIESGIDIPSANTIIINRADKFGLAQLHQLRGRVGRSHHRAYAYLLIPHRSALTPDAEKRLEAIESLENLGAGFLLASHDLEIRGAGEFLGSEQSGHIHEIGYSMYMELLERAVKALKSGKQPELDRPLDHGAEVEFYAPALIPSDYLPDVEARLIIYKRIASAPTTEALRELQVELIDRFGLLPEPLKQLVRITELKLIANPLGIRKIEMGVQGGRILFGEKPNVDPMKIISLIQKQPHQFKLEGQNKLRIQKSFPETHQRIAFVQDLLNSLVSR